MKKLWNDLGNSLAQEHNDDSEDAQLAENFGKFFEEKIDNNRMETSNASPDIYTMHTHSQYISADHHQADGTVHRHNAK